MRKTSLFAISVLSASILACGRAAERKTIVTSDVEGTRVSVSNKAGILDAGLNKLRLKFTDANGRGVPVEAPGLVMWQDNQLSQGPKRNTAVVDEDGVGIWDANVELQRPGLWHGILTWNENGKTKEWRFSTVTDSDTRKLPQQRQ